MFYWHQSYHGNIMTPLSCLLALVFLGSKGFFRNRLRELVPPFVASVMAKFEQTRWERLEIFWNKVSVLIIPCHCFQFRMHVLNFNLHSKGPGLLSEEFPKYANAAEMVKIMSVASLFHHEGRIICIYVSSLQYMLSFTLLSFARRPVNMTGKESRVRLNAIFFMQKLCTCI